MRHDKVQVSLSYLYYADPKIYKYVILTIPFDLPWKNGTKTRKHIIRTNVKDFEYQGSGLEGKIP